MEFNFNCEQILSCDNGMAILEGTFQTAIKPGYILYVNQILDDMGFASSKAQGLNTIITTASKFFSSNHRIFIKAEGNKVIGFIKVGVKKLFIRDQFTNFNEISPLCVLDFYVHESEQRNGHGKVRRSGLRL
jgi:alpha-tubulin N-acetyltransferase 1